MFNAPMVKKTMTGTVIATGSAGKEKVLTIQIWSGLSFSVLGPTAQSGIRSRNYA